MNVMMDNASGVGNAKFTAGTPGTTSGVGPFGDYAYTGTQSPTFNLPAALATGVYGLRYYIGAQTGLLFGVNDNGTTQVAVYRDADGTMRVTRGQNTATLAATAPGFLQTNRYYKFDFKPTIHNTAGAFTLTVDDQPVSWASGATSALNTRASANNQFTQGFWSQGNLAGTRVSHLYVNDTTGAVNNDILVGFRADTLLLDADDLVAGTSSGGGPSTFGNLNDASDTTFNDLAAGSTDRFGVANLIAALGQVYAVAVTPRWYSTDASVGTARVGLDVGGVQAWGATLAPPTAVADEKQQVFNLAPDGTSWTLTAVNALKVLINKLT